MNDDMAMFLIAMVVLGLGIFLLCGKLINAEAKHEPDPEETPSDDTEITT